MDNYNKNDENASLSMQPFFQFFRIASSAMGLIIIVYGFLWSKGLFELTYQAIKNPEFLQNHIIKWINLLSLESMNNLAQGGEITIAPLIAIILMGLGLIILVKIAMGIILIGAKIVLWTSSDREAVKQILIYAFGKGKMRTKGIKETKE